MWESITIKKHRQFVAELHSDFVSIKPADNDHQQDEYDGVPLGVESTITHLETALL